MLTDEAKRKKNEYQRRYREKNRDKIKAYNDNYWNRKALESKIIRKGRMKHEGEQPTTDCN